jgi:xylulokinase
VKGFIGLDLGSTAVKGVLISDDGNVLASAGERVRFKDSDNPAVKEIDPVIYYNQIYSVIKELSQSDITIAAISWVAASGNLIILNDSFEPVTPIYSWMDTTADDGSVSAADTGFTAEDIYRTVGWPFTCQFPLGRLFWIKHNRKELLEEHNYIAMSNDYLGYLLSGCWAVDNSTGTTFCLYDQEKMEKNLSFLSALGLSERQISPILPSGSVLGPVLSQAAKSSALSESLALSESTAVVLGSFDHPGAARALGLHSPKQLMLSCGTSWVGCTILKSREEGLERGMLIDPYETQNGGSWFGMFSLPGAGSYFDSWFTAFMKCIAAGDEVQLDADTNAYALFDNLAMECDPHDTLPVIDPISSKCTAELLESLVSSWDIRAVARSILEGIVFHFRHLMEQKELGIDKYDEILLVGGPTDSPIWSQIIADLFQKQVVIQFGKSAGAVGAAKLAAWGVGFELKPISDIKRIMPVTADAEVLKARYDKFVRE